MCIVVGVGSVTITSDFAKKFPVSAADPVHDSKLLLISPLHHYPLPLGMSTLRLPSKPPYRSDKGLPPAHHDIRPRQARWQLTVDWTWGEPRGLRTTCHHLHIQSRIAIESRLLVSGTNAVPHIAANLYSKAPTSR